MASWGTPLRTLFNSVYDSALHYINVNIGSITGSGLATEAKQDDGIALLTTIDADTSILSSVDFATETTQTTLATENGGNLDTIAGDTTSIDGKTPSLGTAAMAASSPVTIASDDTLITSLKTALEIIDNIVNSHDSAILATGNQILAEAKDFDGAALPNAATEGNAIRPAASLSGIQYTMPVSEDGSLSPIDQTTGYSKSQEQSPIQEQYDAVVSLVSASDIGAVDDTWVTQGDEISTEGRTKLTVWCDLTVNDSTGNQLQVLSRHTSAGDDYIRETSSEYQKTLGDSNIRIKYTFDLENTTPYIIVQTKATDVDTGGGTEGTITINYTMSWM